MSKIKSYNFIFFIEISLTTKFSICQSASSVGHHLFDSCKYLWLTFFGCKTALSYMSLLLRNILSHTLIKINSRKTVSLRSWSGNFDHYFILVLEVRRHLRMTNKLKVSINLCNLFVRMLQRNMIKFITNETFAKNTDINFLYVLYVLISFLNKLGLNSSQLAAYLHEYSRSKVVIKINK